MCGRFTLTADEGTVIIRFNSTKTMEHGYKPRFNIAPSQQVLAVINDGQKNRLGQLKWGFIPRWAKDKRIGFKMLNARAETLAEKPMFKHPFKRQRCIIPSDGFYEWKREGDVKQPYHIRLKSGEVFGFAGLWDRWESTDGDVIHSCTIITTEPNDLMADIHQRMPAILRKEDEQVWLDRKVEDTAVLQDFLRPYDAEEMDLFKVSTEVNSTKNEYDSLLKPLS